MISGYNSPLYILPFDHRQSYVKGMFGYQPPLTPEKHSKVADSKQVIYEGFEQALSNGVSTDHAGLLVDEEFGSAILLDASRKNYITALSAEKSGSDEFEFEYGKDFAAHIEKFDPIFVKVLVRYNPEGDKALNERQTRRLRQLTDHCRNVQRLFMFELLVPANEAQMQAVQGDKEGFDQQLRPGLMAQAIEELQNADVEPDVWKIEGLDRSEDCRRIVNTVHRDGRTKVGCIILGRGADESKVSHWLSVAAGVPGFVGFAVGRTSFWDAIADYESNRATRQQASARIAARYAQWVKVFEQNQPRQDSNQAHATRMESS